MTLHSYATTRATGRLAALLLLAACEGPEAAVGPEPATIQPEMALLPLGGEQKLSTGASGAVWSVSDTLVARMAEDGTVRAVGVGTAVVRASAGEREATAEVTVRARFVAPSAGARFTCSVTDAGISACWGADYYGQLGAGGSVRTEKHWVRAREVGGAIRLVAVDAGGSHACGLDRSGKAYCWGSSYQGQLGNGSQGDFTAASTPRPVSSELSFATVSAGGAHSCALTGEGAAYCWGAAGLGQIGAPVLGLCRDHYGQPRGACALAPTAVAGGLRFRAISAGGSHTCALTTTGEAYCWGADPRGALGRGSAGGVDEPARVSGGLRFSAVAAGDSHSCALDLDGRAWCWGSNAGGRLGVGSADTLSHPAPEPVRGELRFRAISAGGSHTCAVAVDGAVHCWGENSSGELGDGSITPAAAPRRVGGIPNAVAVSAGLSHSCAVSAEERTYCWGSGSRGELGTGLGVGSTVPARVFGQ